MKVSYCCFEISGDCNMYCSFCFSDWRKARCQMPTEKAFHVLDVLKRNGLKAINLTGGEVLLRDDIIEVCSYAKQIGLTTIISTNGIELLNKKEILDHIDAINLPLDAYDADVHNTMRPCVMPDHHSHVLKLIDMLSKDYPNVKIKINTMVSKVNKDDVVRIGELLPDTVFNWKLGKFMASGNGKNHSDTYEITKTEFDDVVAVVSKRWAKKSFYSEDFVFGSEDDFFIDNKGEVVLINDQGLRKAGPVDVISTLQVENGGKYFSKVYERKV